MSAVLAAPGTGPAAWSAPAQSNWNGIYNPYLAGWLTDRLAGWPTGCTGARAAWTG